KKKEEGERMTSTAEIQGLVVYYGREGLWRSLQIRCEQYLKRNMADPVVTFWRGVAIMKDGNIICVFFFQIFFFLLTRDLANR
ncbi:MAG: hypothetical protein ACK41O_26655, partial [Runella zeae]